jgi:hypothetical protein
VRGAWAWSEVAGTDTRDGRVRLRPVGGRPVPLVRLARRDVVLLPRVVQALRSPASGAM